MCDIESGTHFAAPSGRTGPRALIIPYRNGANDARGEWRASILRCGMPLSAQSRSIRPPPEKPTARHPLLPASSRTASASSVLPDTLVATTTVSREATLGSTYPFATST